MPEIAVIGGGIAGLSAAFAARQRGFEVTVFEAADTPGGLLAAFEIEGYRFDNAVHLSFATEPEVREIFDRTPYYTHNPESMCWDGGYWLRHPVQNNMHPLPVEEKIRLITGMVDRENRSVENYRDWLLHQYGEPIAARWPLVYTRKYWRLEAEALGVDWVGNRMRRAALDEVLRGALAEDKSNTYYVKEMRYPKQGGYFSFLRPLLEGCDLRPDHKMIGLDPIGRTIIFANGETQHYDQIISTIPLPDLISAMRAVPQTIKELASSLIATRLDLISVGFNRPDVSPNLWFYIYDEDIEAARAYSPSWKSPDNVPEGKSSLQFEIYSHPHQEKADRTPEYLKENTARALARMGLASKSDTEFLHHKHLAYGNVIFDLGMEPRRDMVRGWLQENDIHTAGRFGEWDYLWSNQAFMSGRRAALALRNSAASQY